MMQETTMNSGGVAVGDSPTPGNLLDEFEEAFQSCFAPLIKEDSLNGVNHEELKTSAENNAQKFFDLAYRMESVFLQKRFLLSVQRPEVLIQEENNEIRAEIFKKDELIRRHLDKLSEWQNTMADLTSRVAPLQSNVVSKTTTTPIPFNSSPSNNMNPLTPGTPQVNMGGMSPAQLSHPGTPAPMNTLNQSPIMGQVVGGGSSIPGMNQTRYTGIPTLSSPTSQMHAGGAMGVPQGSLTGPNIVPQMGPAGGMGNMGSMAPAGMNTNMYPNDGMGPMSGLQGPLAYLEKTTTNIGMPDGRR